MQTNVKLIKDTAYSSVQYIILQGGDIMIRVSPDSRKVQAVMTMPPPKCNNLQSFLSIDNNSVSSPQ